MLFCEAPDFLYHASPDTLKDADPFNRLSGLESFDDGLSPGQHLSHGVPRGTTPFLM